MAAERKGTALSEVSVNKCPAFAKGCPFAGSEGAGQSAVSADVLATKCPAFAEGCPFKHAKTAVELESALSRVPVSHAVEGSEAQSALAALLASTHVKSAAAKESVGKSCPVFAAECPFKRVETLRKAAEWRGWWTLETEEEEDEPEEMVGLAAALKEGTEAAHAEAENVQFVRALLERRAPLAAYCALVASLGRIYGALERASSSVDSSDPVVARICGEFGPKLRRVEAVAEDLEFYRRLDPRAERAARAFADASPAVEAYVRRLDRLDPTLLVAHLYTRYLGDLSGGQILKRAVKRGFLGNDDSRGGTRFYDFPLIGGPVQLRKFKDRYRRALDALALDDPAPVVREAVAAFRLNTALLTELDALLAPPAHPRPTSGAVCPFLAAKSAAAPAAVCPFLAGRPDAAHPAFKPATVRALRFSDYLLLVLLAALLVSLASTTFSRAALSAPHSA